MKISEMNMSGETSLRNAHGSGNIAFRKRYQAGREVTRMPTLEVLVACDIARELHIRQHAHRQTLTAVERLPRTSCLATSSRACSPILLVANRILHGHNDLHQRPLGSVKRSARKPFICSLMAKTSIRRSQD